MTVIMNMRRHEVVRVRVVAVVAVVVGVLACLSVVSADRGCGGWVNRYMWNGGPCGSDSPVLVSDSVGDHALTADQGGGVMMDTGKAAVSEVPARRKLQGSGETAGGVITSIVFMLIIAASIWCCCTGRCCGPQVVVQQQSVAQATAQTQVNNQNVTVQIPEQKPVAAAPTYTVNFHGNSTGPGLAEVLGAVSTAQAGAAQATAQAQVGPAGSVETAHLRNGSAPPGTAQSYYPPQQAQYHPSPDLPAPGYPAGPQTYPPQEPSLKSPLSSDPPPKMA